MARRVLRMWHVERKARGVKCPTCLAPVGQKCFNSDYRARSGQHPIQTWSHWRRAKLVYGDKDDWWRKVWMAR